MIKMIAAVSENMVIGKDNDLPWENSYPEDLKNFKKLTLNSTVIMGKNTFISIGSKPLPKRRNIVVTSSVIDSAECYPSLKLAIKAAKKNTSSDIWLIGGRGIYQEGLKYCQEIHLTHIPEKIEGDNLVYFPNIDFNFNLFLTEELSVGLYKKIYVRESYLPSYSKSN